MPSFLEILRTFWFLYSLLYFSLDPTRQIHHTQKIFLTPTHQKTSNTALRKIPPTRQFSRLNVNSIHLKVNPSNKRKKKKFTISSFNLITRIFVITLALFLLPTRASSFVSEIKLLNSILDHRYTM